MKVLTIKINNKIYSTGKITARLSREALKIQAESVNIGQKGKELIANSDDIENAKIIVENILELRDKKSWLICEAYNRAFTIDDLENNLDDEEIDSEINKIISGITGVITKN